RPAKEAAVGAIGRMVTSTPFLEDQSTPASWNPITPCWTPGSEEASLTSPVVTDAVGRYNEAMDTIASLTTQEQVEREPLKYQLKTPFQNLSDGEQLKFVKKAKEDCLHVCNVIAPGNGEELFESMMSVQRELFDGAVPDDLVVLMTAYKNAKTRNLKKQILSLYAQRYPMTKLKKIHQPYGSLSTWEIKQARSHAKMHGPGTMPEIKTKHRVRLDMGKVDHFVEFINRPYFYQDVSYGNKVLTLDNGDRIEMPNVVRILTRSTMIEQYLEYCKEQCHEPLSRSSLFKILEVREASQRKSLQGLDNTAADGAAGFQTIETLVETLEKGGMEKHDPVDPELQHPCPHQHQSTCEQCQGLKDVLKEVRLAIEGSSWKPYSCEQREDVLYDFDRAQSDILLWKAHIVRSINQEEAKQDALKSEDPQSAILIMDWAMKFLQIKFREKQSEWFGKRGLSWHISTFITKNVDSGKIELQSYAHIFDSCQQDWYAVCSIIENTLEVVKKEHPQITQVNLRSDEAGCYHNNFLLAAVRDAGRRVGIEVALYDFSEPQYGKDICDRILCPMKSSIRRYCNEGHDVVSAKDMRVALSERPVQGTTASVCAMNETQKTLELHKIEGFSKYHNFKFEVKGIRAWKAYGVGLGKFIPYRERETNSENEQCNGLFSCSEPGCNMVFKKFSELENHLDVGEHSQVRGNSDTVYDKLRRDWAEKFRTVDKDEEIRSVPEAVVEEHHEKNKTGRFPECSDLQTGWVLHKPRNEAVRFPTEVKQNLTTKFDLEERTGIKSDPAKVAADVRTARNPDSSRMFERKHWLTKGQVQGFFSRLAASRRSK
ncbi:unnamed protein product, partial [Porites lobata]